MSRRANPSAIIPSPVSSSRLLILLLACALACSAQDDASAASNAGGTSSRGGETTLGGATTTDASTSTSGGCAGWGTPVRVGVAQPSALESLSGLVASRSQPGVYYAHPDRSGPIFFALQESGTSLAEFTLSGVTTTDCEDIAVGPSPVGSNTLFLGDIGDNAARPGTGNGRSEIQVYRLPEPSLSEVSDSSIIAIANWEMLRLVYPDRPHDAEALLVDPVGGEILIVTREANGSAFVFSAPGATPPETITTLTLLATIQVGGSGANAGDISPAGDLALIRTYEAAWLYSRRPGTTWQEAFATTPQSIPVADETQSEGATFSADGKSWLSSGEATPTIYRAKSGCP